MGVHGVTGEVELLGDTAVGHPSGHTGADAQLRVRERGPPVVPHLTAGTRLDHGISGCRGGTGSERVLRRRHIVGVVDHRAVQQHLGMGEEHLDEHVRPELLQVVEAHEDGGRVLDGLVDRGLVQEQVLPARGPGQHPRHLTGDSEKLELISDRRVHALGEEAQHVADTELPRAEVRVRCSFDVQLCRTPGVARAKLSHGAIPDQRRLDIVDQAQTLVAVAQPLLEEGIQQPVALGRA